MFGIAPILSENTVTGNCEIATIIPRGTSLRLGKSACFCYYPAMLTRTLMAGKYCILPIKNYSIRFRIGIFSAEFYFLYFRK